MLPFGGGHRACIGQDLAWFELKIIIIRVMQRGIIFEDTPRGRSSVYLTLFDLPRFPSSVTNRSWQGRHVNRRCMCSTTSMLRREEEEKSDREMTSNIVSTPAFALLFFSLRSSPSLSLTSTYGRTYTSSINSLHESTINSADLFGETIVNWIRYHQ